MKPRACRAGSATIRAKQWSCAYGRCPYHAYRKLRQERPLPQRRHERFPSTNLDDAALTSRTDMPGTAADRSLPRSLEVGANDCSIERSLLTELGSSDGVSALQTDRSLPAELGGDVNGCSIARISHCASSERRRRDLIYSNRRKSHRTIAPSGATSSIAIGVCMRPDRLRMPIMWSTNLVR